MSQAKFAEALGGAGSTTLNGTSHTTSGGVVGGQAINMIDVVPNTLTAYLDVVAKTNTMTLSAKWQVSHDNSTWVDVEMDTANAIANSDVARVLATGTGSAVETKTVSPAPKAVYGWRWARVCVVVGVADSGDASDAWAYNYNYVREAFH